MCILNVYVIAIYPYSKDNYFKIYEKIALFVFVAIDMIILSHFYVKYKCCHNQFFS